MGRTETKAEQHAVSNNVLKLNGASEGNLDMQPAICCPIQSSVPYKHKKEKKRSGYLSHTSDSHLLVSHSQSDCSNGQKCLIVIMVLRQ